MQLVRIVKLEYTEWNLHLQSSHLWDTLAWLTDKVSLLCICYRYQDHDQKKN